MMTKGLGADDIFRYRAATHYIHVEGRLAKAVQASNG